jgi:hypothetical protein
MKDMFMEAIRRLFLLSIKSKQPGADFGYSVWPQAKTPLARSWGKPSSFVVGPAAQQPSGVSTFRLELTPLVGQPIRAAAGFQPAQRLRSSRSRPSVIRKGAFGPAPLSSSTAPCRTA